MDSKGSFLKKDGLACLLKYSLLPNERALFDFVQRMKHFTTYPAVAQQAPVHFGGKMFLTAKQANAMYMFSNELIHA